MRMHDRELGRAQALGIARDGGATRCVLLDGDRLGAVCGPQPLDGDGAAAGADVPQPLSRKRGQAGKGGGANIALGDHAVRLEEHHPGAPGT